MPAGLTFRESGKEDLARISEFRKKFFPDDSSTRSHEPEYYEWKCYQNPFQQGELWLAEDGDEIVGSYGITPKRMRILGAIAGGTEVGDSFTRPDYQRRGILTRLAKATIARALERGMPFIYALPNQSALPAYEKKLDYAAVPIKLRNLVKLLKPKQVLNAKLHLPPLAAAFSPVVEIASKAIFAICMGGIAKSNIMVHQEPSFPDDMDVFWQQAANKYDVILVRTKDYLDWRYVANPDAYTILVARDGEGGFLGYMVTKTGFIYGNAPVGFIVDFLTLEHDPNIFKRLLVAAFKGFHQKEVNFVSAYTVKGSHYDRILVRAGFFPYGKIPLMCYNNELGSQVSGHTYRWHFTMGDTDNV